MTRPAPFLGTSRYSLVLLLAAGMLFLFADRLVAAVAKDGRGEVRVAGLCGSGATSKLSLKGRDGGIEVRFEVDEARAGISWRFVLVHERRIAWRGTAVTTRSNGSFEVRRTLQDLPGADTVIANAWGERGLVCRAIATLPHS